MRISELNDDPTKKLAALSQFLIGRMDDTGTEGKISIPAFVQMANSLGIAVTEDTLRDLVDRQPLSNLITSVDDREIRFRGTDNPADPKTLSVSQSEKIVDKLAKRAAKP